MRPNDRFSRVTEAFERSRVFLPIEKKIRIWAFKFGRKVSCFSHKFHAWEKRISGNERRKNIKLIFCEEKKLSAIATIHNKRFVIATIQYKTSVIATIQNICNNYYSFQKNLTIARTLHLTH